MVGLGPVEHRQRPRQELHGGDKGSDAQVGQVLVGAQQPVEGIAGHDDGGNQPAPGPQQPAVDVVVRAGLVHRQHHVVEHHARQRQGDHYDQTAGGRYAADEGYQGQPVRARRHAQGQGEVFGVGRHVQIQAGPEDRRDCQAHQQQEQRQSPAGGTQCPRVEILGEGHVIHVRHDDGRSEEHQQQGAPGTFLQRAVQGLECFLVVAQPQLQPGGAFEDHEQCVQPDCRQAQQLDHGLEGDGEHQPLVLFPGRNMAGAEQDGEQHDQQAEAEGHRMLTRLQGEYLHRIGHRLDLQCQQRQHAQQHEQGRQGAGPGAAETEGEQVCQGRQLVGAGDAQYRVEQHRRQQEGAADAKVVRQESVTVLIGQTDSAIEGPGAGIDANRQGVDGRVAHQ